MCALLLSFEMQSFAAADENSDTQSIVGCECPAIDSLASPSCGPEPKKLKTKFFEDQKDSCENTSNPVSGSMRLVAGKAVEALDNMKSPVETLSYLNCYKDPSSSKKFCHYKNTLASHIALAAESAGLPFSVQSCLFFRESGFNSQARSPVGAMGYVQFMPDTLDSIKPIIVGSIEDWEEDIADANKDLVEPREKLAIEMSKQEKIDALNVRKKHDTSEIKRIDTELLKPQTPQKKILLKDEREKFQNDLKAVNGELAIAPLPNRSKMTSYKKKINYYETLINTWSSKIAAKRVWDRYWEGTSKMPTKFSNESLKCPQVAFALAAVKQTYDLGLINSLSTSWNPETIAKDGGKFAITINGMDERDSAIMLGGAYNAGIGGLAGRCGAAATLDECAKKFPKGKETWVYMHSVRNCAEKNGTESMRYNSKTGKWIGKKDCEATKCDQ